MNPFTKVAPAVKNFAVNNKKWLLIGLAGVALFGGGLATGRYAMPTSSTTVEKSHEVAKEHIVVQTKIETVYVHDLQKDQKIHRTVTETTKPNGEKTKTTTEDVGTSTNVHDNTKAAEIKYVDREKIVEKIVEKTVKISNLAGWRVAAGAGVAIPYFLGQSSPGIPGLSGAVINLEVDRKIVGPLWIGLGANTQGVLSLNLSGVF